jgi:hypothetical protein
MSVIASVELVPEPATPGLTIEGCAGYYVHAVWSVLRKRKLPTNRIVVKLDGDTERQRLKLYELPDPYIMAAAIERELKKGAQGCPPLPTE